MADAPDSKSGGGNPVGVQVPPPAPTNQSQLRGAPIIPSSVNPLNCPCIVRRFFTYPQTFS